jgi:hypothetical protein
MYCTFVLFVNQHFPGLPASGTHCTISTPSNIYQKGIPLRRHYPTKITSRSAYITS